MSPPVIAIRAEPSATDPDSCRFRIAQALHPGGPYVFRGADEASGSPLAERLFAHEEIFGVMVHREQLTIEKAPSASWKELAPKIAATVRAVLAEPGPWLSPELKPGFVNVRPDEELAALARGVIDEQVNPGVAGHGGKIHVESVRDRNLYLRLSGGCQGCSASQVTLKQGVEVVIRKALPEIEDIIDTTDHGEGTQPFYA